MPRNSSNARPRPHAQTQGKAQPAAPGVDLQKARAAARERYLLISMALKREAGVRRHLTHKEISGLAWLEHSQILGPEGVTRRQLYVLAHECGHIVLHSSPDTWPKPGHVKEHEAETYAHRAFLRYGLDVPERSAEWARAYVGRWIMKDRAEGLPICPMAQEFAEGRRSPYAPLPSVDGKPSYDLSRVVDRMVAKGNRIAEVQSPLGEMVLTQVVPAQLPPNACGTCEYFERKAHLDDSGCRAFATYASSARHDTNHCAGGRGWRPSEFELRRLETRGRGFWARLSDAVIERIRGRR